MVKLQIGERVVERVSKSVKVLEKNTIADKLMVTKHSRWQRTQGWSLHLLLFVFHVCLESLKHQQPVVGIRQ